MCVCVCVEGGGGVKLLHLSKTRYNRARNFKFDTEVHTHIQFQKIHLLVPSPF